MITDVYKRMFEFEKEYWWFVGRRELIINLFKKFVGAKVEAKRILDVGCGTGGTTKELMCFGNTVAIDNSSYAIKYAISQGIQPIVKCDAQRIPFKNKVFDFVFMLDVLEHLREDKNTIGEIETILKPRGYCFLTVPAFRFLWSRHDIVHGHYRRYVKESLKKILPDGLKIERITYWNFFLFILIVVSRFLTRSSSVTRTDLRPLSKFINKLLLFFIRFENFLINKHINLPFGVSLICVLKKVDG